RLDFATGALGPMMSKPPLAADGGNSFTFDGDRVVYPRGKELVIADPRTGIEKVVATVGGDFVPGSIFAPVGAEHVFYFEKEASGAVNAHTVRKDGTEAAKMHRGLLP